MAQKIYQFHFRLKNCSNWFIFSFCLKKLLHSHLFSRIAQQQNFYFRFSSRKINLKNSNLHFLSKSYPQKIAICVFAWKIARKKYSNYVVFEKMVSKIFIPHCRLRNCPRKISILVNFRKIAQNNYFPTFHYDSLPHESKILPRSQNYAKTSSSEASPLFVRVIKLIQMHFSRVFWGS